jgi:hypothetical protein
MSIRDRSNQRYFDLLLELANRANATPQKLYTYTSPFLLRSCRIVYHLLRPRLRSPAPTPFSPACFLLPGYFFNRPCGIQIGKKFWDVLCDEHGIGGSGEYAA